LAYISSLLTNLAISIHGKKGTKNTVPIDFMLDWDLEKVKEPKKQSVEEMKAILKEIADNQNRRYERQQKSAKLNLMNRPPRRFRQTNTPSL